jgi:hypothetical protein
VVSAPGAVELQLSVADEAAGEAALAGLPAADVALDVVPGAIPDALQAAGERGAVGLPAAGSVQGGPEVVVVARVEPVVAVVARVEPVAAVAVLVEPVAPVAVLVEPVAAVAAAVPARLAAGGGIEVRAQAGDLVVFVPVRVLAALVAAPLQDALVRVLFGV